MSFGLFIKLEHPSVADRLYKVEESREQVLAELRSIADFYDSLRGCNTYVIETQEDDTQRPKFKVEVYAGGDEGYQELMLTVYTRSVNDSVYAVPTYIKRSEVVEEALPL